LVCRLCGASNPPQQASCATCGLPLEQPPARGGPHRHAEPRTGWFVWLSVCLALGAGLGLLIVTLRTSGPLLAARAFLGAAMGAALGAVLGTLPGPTLKVLRRAWGAVCMVFCDWSARRCLWGIRKTCEESTSADDRDMQLRLAAALFLEDARDRAEQVLARLLESDSASALARHNFAVTQACAGRLARAAEELERARAHLGRSPALLWNLGIVRWKQGMLPEAAQAFAELLELAHEDCQARSGLALALAQQGEFDQAIAELERALAGGRRHPDILCNLGIIHQARGEIEVAEHYFTGALQRQPGHLAARYDRGLCAMLRGWYHAAIEDFSAVTRLAPDHAWALVQQGVCWYRLGHSNRALEAMRRALRIRPDDFQVRYNTGTLMAREELTDSALRQLERAHELNSQDVDVIINLGVACRFSGRLDHFRAACRLNARHALARYDCALAYNMVDMYEEAERQLEQLLTAYPDFPEAFNAIGVVRLLQNRLVEAAAQFRRAADALPRSAIVRSNLGLTYCLQGDLGAAAEQLRYATSLDPRLTAAHDIAGHAALGLGETGAAIEHFRTLAKLEPSNPDAHSNLALAYYRDDRLNEAIESYKRALIFAPNSPEGHNDLGLAYAKNRMLEEALRYLQKVIDWRPNNPIVRSNTGVVYYFRGEAEKAVEQWREVTRLSPSYARRRQSTRFSAYDDQEMAVRPIDRRRRVTHFPLKVAGFRHSFQLALDENDHRMELRWPDLRAAANWQDWARRARSAIARP